MNSVNDIADFFIHCTDPESGDVMTHLKLQKLLYYAQGWHLAQRGVPLFEEELVAWPHGPVCPEIWHRFKGRKWDPIMPDEAYNSPDDMELDEEFLEDIWEDYGQYSAKWLENLTHQEEPWQEAFNRGGAQAVISKDSMKEFFSRQLEGHAVDGER